MAEVMESVQQNNSERDIERNIPQFQQKRKEREETQKNLQIELKRLLAQDPPIDANVKELDDFLKNEQWTKLEDLVQTTRGFDPPNDFSPPAPKIISCKLVKAVEHVFMKPTGKLKYLMLLIPHFEIENVLFGEKRYAPIHYAVDSLDEEFLNWLLSPVDANEHALVDINLRNMDKKTALYMLCEKYDKCNSASKERAKIIHLIERLLDAGADFNVCCGPNQLPFDLLLKRYDNDVAVKQLVDRYETQSNRAIAYSVCGENESQQRLVKFYKREGNGDVHVTAELLELLLQFGDLEQFNHHWKSFTVDQNNVKKVIELVLRVAVERKLNNIVRQIVDIAGSMIFEKRRENSLELKHRLELKGLLWNAAQGGNLEILKLLMPKMKDDQELVNCDALLVQTLEKAHSSRQKENETYRCLECAKYLINSKVVSLHKTTKSGNTPLHLAVKYRYDEVVVALLENGCGSLSVCNRANLTPLECGTYNFWRACFDKFIKGDSSKQDWKTIDFETNCFQPPTIELLTDSKAAEPLTGWKKIIPIRTAKEASAHSGKRVVVTEMTPLRVMAESQELKRLLTHPVIYAFVVVKGIQLNLLHLLNLLLTMVTILSFGKYSLSVCNVGNPASQIFLMVLSVIGSLLMAAREGIQLCLLPRSYANLENVVDIGSIVLMNVVLWGGCYPLLSSVVVLTSALQMVFMLSALPFKRLSTIMYMFKTVSVNYIKSLLLFLLLILAFVFAFYLSSNVNVGSDTLNHSHHVSETKTQDNEDFHKFLTVMNAVVKTVVMTIGELDAANLDLAGGKVILFLVFLFIGPLVILNLMNGLAVSDITAIQQESELISISKKVVELERIERLMVSFKREWIRRWFPNPFLKHHSSKIGVRIDELGKILVRRRQQEQPTLQQTNTEGSGVAEPGNNSAQQEQDRSPKPTSSKTGVRIDELGSISVRRKQQEQPTLQQTNTEGSGVAEPLPGNNSDQQDQERSPKPFLKHHISRIGVRTYEIWKSLFCRKPSPTNTQASTKTNTFSLPVFPPLFSEGTDIVLDLNYVQLTSFLKLDRTILREAETVIESRGNLN